MAPAIAGGLISGGLGLVSSLLGGVLNKNDDNPYEDLIRAYNVKAKKALAGLAGAEAQAREDVTQNWKNNLSEAQQDLITRGLSGTSVKTDTERAVLRDRNADLNRLATEWARLRAGIQTGAAGAALSAGMNQPQAPGFDYSALSRAGNLLGAAFGQGGFFGKQQVNVYGGQTNTGGSSSTTIPDVGGTPTHGEWGEPPPAPPPVAPPPKITAMYKSLSKTLPRMKRRLVA